jgi:hypothetical protein
VPTTVSTLQESSFCRSFVPNTLAVDTVDVSQTLNLEPPAQRELDTRDLLNRRVGTPKSCGEAHLAQLVEDHPPIQEPLQDDRQRIVGLMLPASVV